MPFGYGEQAPFLGRKISAIRLGDGARQRRGRRRRHAGTSQSDPLSPPRPGLRVDPRVARRRHRARGRDGRARLPRQPDHPRLGDRARPADGAGPVPRRRDRPVRPQPAAAAAAAGRLARAPDAVRRLALDRAPRRARRPGRRVPPWLRRSRRRPEAPRSATGRSPVSPSSACSRRSGGGARARVLVPVAPAGGRGLLAGYAVSLVALGGVAVATALISPYGLALRPPVALRLAVAAAGRAALGLGSRRPLRRRARRAGARRSS